MWYNRKKNHPQESELLVTKQVFRKSVLQEGVQLDTIALRRKYLHYNVRNGYFDMALWSINLGVTAPFLGAFIIHLGASNQMVGYLTSLPALVATVALIPAARLVDRQVAKRPLMLRATMWHRLFFGLMILVPMISIVDRAWLFIGICLAMTIPLAVASLAWTSMMGNVIPAEIQGMYFGNRAVISGLVSVSCTFLAGRLLDATTFPGGYQILFTIALLAAAGSYIFLGRVKEIIPSKPLPKPEAESSSAWFIRLIAPFTHAEYGQMFTLVCASAFLFQFGMTLAFPLFPIKQIRIMHMSDGAIGLMAAVQGLANVLGAKFWGPIIDRRGNRLVFGLSTLGLSVIPLIWALATSMTPLWIAVVWAGLTGGGFGLSQFTILLERSPERERASFAATYNIILNSATFLGPTIGAYLSIQPWCGMYGTFMLSGTGRLLGSLTMLLFPWFLIQRNSTLRMDTKV